MDNHQGRSQLSHVGIQCMYFTVDWMGKLDAYLVAKAKLTNILANLNRWQASGGSLHTAPEAASLSRDVWDLLIIRPVGNIRCDSMLVHLCCFCPPFYSDWLPWWIWVFSNKRPNHVTFQGKQAFFLWVLKMHQPSAKNIFVDWLFSEWPVWVAFSS